jgi:hypothetical protein
MLAAHVSPLVRDFPASAAYAMFDDQLSQICHRCHRYVTALHVSRSPSEMIRVQAQIEGAIAY